MSPPLSLSIVNLNAYAGRLDESNREDHTRRVYPCDIRSDNNGAPLKPFFEASDFNEYLKYGFPLHPPDAAHLANEKLRREGRVVYGKIPETNGGWNGAWTFGESKADTHTAMLINIQPIEKVECKHEPINYCDYLEGGTVLKSGNKCKYCGIELIATWSAKDGGEG